MFDFIRRLFGAAAPGTGRAPGAVATITVALPDSVRAGPRRGRLVARDAAEGKLLTAWATVGADPAAAARLTLTGAAGGPPEGDYTVDAVLPAREDAAGVALFGRHPMLRFRVRDGGAVSSGRAAWLIHGGPAGPTDGSIRLSDPDLRRLLDLLPADPGPVLVRLVRGADAVEEDWAPDTVGDTGEDAAGYDDSALIYEQLYAWTETAPGSPPYPPLAESWTGDNDAAAALAGLGYGVLPDPGGAAPGTAGPDGTALGTTGAAMPDAGWSPTGGAYGA